MFLLFSISGAFPICGGWSISGNGQLHCIGISHYGPSVWPRVWMGPLMLLNELMTQQEMRFKDTSAGNRITCAVYRAPFPSHNSADPCTPSSLCTCWHELYFGIVCRVELLSPFYGILFGWEMMYQEVWVCVSCPELIELSGFHGYQRPLISCHISVCVCFDICLWHKHFA